MQEQQKVVEPEHTSDSTQPSKHSIGKCLTCGKDLKRTNLSQIMHYCNKDCRKNRPKGRNKGN